MKIKHSTHLIKVFFQDQWIKHPLESYILFFGITLSLASLFLPMLSFSIFGNQSVYFYRIWILFSSESFLKFLLISIFFYPYILLFILLWTIVSNSQYGKHVKKCWIISKLKNINLPLHTSRKQQLKSIFNTMKQSLHVAYFLGLVNIFVYFAYYINPFHSLWQKALGILLIALVLIIAYHFIHYIRQQQQLKEISEPKYYGALYSILSFSYTSLILMIIIEKADAVFVGSYLAWIGSGLIFIALNARALRKQIRT